MSCEPDPFPTEREMKAQAARSLNRGMYSNANRVSSKFQ